MLLGPGGGGGGEGGGGGGDMGGFLIQVGDTRGKLGSVVSILCDLSRGYLPYVLVEGVPPDSISGTKKQFFPCPSYSSDQTVEIDTLFQTR